jgi:aminoglycoside N3'-acetyltransferase
MIVDGLRNLGIEAGDLVMVHRLLSAPTDPGHPSRHGGDLR